MPEDLEKRVQALEKSQALDDDRLVRLMDDVGDIKRAIDSIKEASVKSENIIRVESVANAAHKRLDVFEKDLSHLQWGHEACQKNRLAESATLKEIKESISNLTSEINAVKQAVSTQTADEKGIKKFFVGRLEKLVDVIGLALIVFILAMYVKHTDSDELTAAKKEIQELHEKLNKSPLVLPEIQEPINGVEKPR